MTAPLYEKCLHCHLFIEQNSSFADLQARRYVDEFVHLHRGTAADEALDESHEATPSGMIATLAAWKAFGPPEMLKRFWEADQPSVILVTDEGTEAVVTEHHSAQEALASLRANFAEGEDDVPDDELVRHVASQGVSVLMHYR